MNQFEPVFISSTQLPEKYLDIFDKMPFKVINVLCDYTQAAVMGSGISLIKMPDFKSRGLCLSEEKLKAVGSCLWCLNG